MTVPLRLAGLLVALGVVATACGAPESSAEPTRPPAVAAQSTATPTPTAPPAPVVASLPTPTPMRSATSTAPLGATPTALVALAPTPALAPSATPTATPLSLAPTPSLPAPTPTLISYGIILYREGVGDEPACYPLAVSVTPWIVHWETDGVGSFSVRLRNEATGATLRDIVDVELKGRVGEQGQVIVDDLTGSFCFTVAAPADTSWGIHFGLPQ